MSEAIKTGGMGKNPAIEKLNRLAEVSNQMQAASELKACAFQSGNTKVTEVFKRRKQIVEKFSIGFKETKMEMIEPLQNVEMISLELGSENAKQWGAKKEKPWMRVKEMKTVTEVQELKLDIVFEKV